MITRFFFYNKKTTTLFIIRFSLHMWSTCYAVLLQKINHQIPELRGETVVQYANDMLCINITVLFHQTKYEKF